MTPQPRLARAGSPKRSVVIAGHRTSVSLEAPFWAELQGIAARRRTSVAALIAAIDAGRRGGNLSSAIRIFVLEDALSRAQPAEEPPS